MLPISLAAGGSYIDGIHIGISNDERGRLRCTTESKTVLFGFRLGLSGSSSLPVLMIAY